MQTDPGASGLHPQVNGKFRKILDVLPWERHSKSTRTQDGTKWLSTSSSDVACQTHARECSLQQLLLTGEDEIFQNQKTRAAGAAATKYHRRGGWDNRHCVCHSSGGRKSEAKVWAGRFSEASLPGLSMAIFSLCPHMVSPLRVSSLISPSQGHSAMVTKNRKIYLCWQEK